MDSYYKTLLVIYAVCAATVGLCVASSLLGWID